MLTHPVNRTQLKTMKCVYLCNSAMHLCKLYWSMILVTHRETDWAKLVSTNGLFLHVDRQTVKPPGRHDSACMPKQRASQHVAEGTRTVYSLILSGKNKLYFKYLEQYFKSIMKFSTMIYLSDSHWFHKFVGMYLINPQCKKSTNLCLCSVCSVVDLQVQFTTPMTQSLRFKSLHISKILVRTGHLYPLNYQTTVSQKRKTRNKNNKKINNNTGRLLWTAINIL